MKEGDFFVGAVYDRAQIIGLQLRNIAYSGTGIGPPSAPGVHRDDIEVLNQLLLFD